MSFWVASVKKYNLQFKIPAGTSRGVMHEKPSWIIRLLNRETGASGIGECSVIPGLSPDFNSCYEEKLTELVNQINQKGLPDSESLQGFPSISFGIETALLDAENGGGHILFPSDFTRGERGIPINGLIWMGMIDEMLDQIKIKIRDGFRCLKLKIGALDFENELDLLKRIRLEYPSENLEIRLDANGAFSFEEAPEKLCRLSDFNIHSIEQPIQPGQREEMAGICSQSPIDIALDEELIGLYTREEAGKLLQEIQPKYIILKPSLLGGYKKTAQWIEIAGEKGIDWWVTSALESSIGLNGIAQWVYTLNNPLVHGLGTGQIYKNNIFSPLKLNGTELWYDPLVSWNFNFQNL